MLISVTRFNFILVCFKAAYHANPGAVSKRAGSVHLIQDAYFECSQIH